MELWPTWTTLRITALRYRCHLNETYFWCTGGIQLVLIRTGIKENSKKTLVLIDLTGYTNPFLRLFVISGLMNGTFREAG